MPFGDDVTYIFDKQIEEAGLLVLNKADLLSPAERRAVLDRGKAAWPDKSLRLQDSRQNAHIAQWVALLLSNAAPAPLAAVDIDYARYGAGEAHLAWLDQAVSLTAPASQLRACVVRVIAGIRAALGSLPIGHVKFMVETPAGSVKISLPAGDETGWEPDVPALDGQSATLLINARVQAGAAELRALVQDAIAQAGAAGGATVRELDAAAFHPSFPRPTHRMR
jgi:hypothetical protein